MVSAEGKLGGVTALPVERPVDVGGCSLQARVWEPAAETGVPYILLHGIAANARTWDGVAARLAAAGHLTCAVDFRGHGGSNAPNDGYEMLSFAEDFVGAVDGLELTLPIAVGHSLGACVALETAARDPDLLRGIVLVEGGAAPGNSQFDSFEELLAAMTLPPVGGMPLGRLRGLLGQMHPDYEPWQLDALMASFREGPDGTAEWRLTPPRYEALLRALWEQRTMALWRDLLVPALLILADTGDERWTAAKRAGLAEIRGITESVREEWLGTEHETHMAHPAELADRILEATRDGFLTAGMRYR